MLLARPFLLTVILIPTIWFSATAQDKTLLDTIADRIEWAGLQKPSTTLFVYFDKNIYSTNENVWLTAYILKTNIAGTHHTLSVALIRNDDRSVLAQAKFVMDKELAFGNMFLPDSLPTGDYSFVCYTNLVVNNYPAAVFVQPVTIKSSDVAGFIANLSLKDTIKPGMDSAAVLLKAYTKDITLVKGGLVKYFIGDRLHPLRSGTLKTDNFGEATINIPLKQITTANNTLQAAMYNGKEIKNFSLRLPVYKKETLVQFYPEGGHLIEGVSNTIGWQATNNEAEPLQLNALLYQDGKPLQAIATGFYGMGKFVFTPQKGSSYFVKLTSPAGDSQYVLPKALMNGTAINIVNAVANDTLLINVNDAGAAGKILLLVHDYRSSFITAPLVTTGKPMLVKIPLMGVPRGIATVTVLDSLGRPLAERLVFAHFNERATVAVTADSAVYRSRQQVKLTIKITDAGHQPVTGLVSVACVQNSRLDVKKLMDIESYTYLKEGLNDVPFKKDILSNNADNKAYLEQLLLIKGWRKYQWQDVENVKPADTATHSSSLAFKGTVLHDQKKLKRPLLLNVKQRITSKLSDLSLVTTDSIGRFELLPASLLSFPFNKLELTVRNNYPEEYNIAVTDPYKAMNRQLSASLPFTNYNPPLLAQSSKAYVLRNDEIAKTLKAVVVTSKKDNSFFRERIPGNNACGDYVCMYNILNCTNHRNEGFVPVVGMTYGTRFGSSGMVTQTIYTGCAALDNELKNHFLFTMEGIYSQKEFYVADLSRVDISDPQYLSTIYWNHALLTDSNGMAEVSFYTSDITGKFRIIIQGITNNNVVYGEQAFEVRE